MRQYASAAIPVPEEEWSKTQNTQPKWKEWKEGEEWVEIATQQYMVNGINYLKKNNNKLNSSFPNKNNAIVDSGASGHYFPINSPQQNTHKTNTQFTITQPNGEKLVSTQEASLNILPTLPAAAKEVQVFNNIKYPLLSVAKLCDVDCNVLFSKNKVTIEHNNKIIAEAPRDNLSNLWTMVWG